VSAGSNGRARTDPRTGVGSYKRVRASSSTIVTSYNHEHWSNDQFAGSTRVREEEVGRERGTGE
jgi:hypothetical protein